MPVGPPILFIAGISEDKVFTHVCYIAHHLSQMLSNFQFERICKQSEEWELWLKNFCELNNWSHTNSPLIWRAVGKLNTTYVGGATQFWEFIHEYYGVESRLTKDELKTLNQDFVQETERGAPKSVFRATEQKRNIAILGADKSTCEKLAVELLSIEILHLAKGIVIKVYNMPSHIKKMDSEIRDVGAISKSLHAVKIVQTISAALVNCEILIILEEILREDEETTDDWLNRNRVATLELAAQINNFAPDYLKVIFCSTGPTCFNAGVLAGAVTKLDTSNIVVVGAYQSLEILDEMLSLVGVPLEEMGCPMIWGFLGINHFVDMCNAVQKHEVYRPNKRAIKPYKGTSLPVGVRQAELRSFFYVAHDKNPYVNLLEHKVVRTGDFQKFKAICDLLTLWYKESCDADGEIISLGIHSDGTFGIPEGIFFSQPVYLKELEDDSRRWVPCSEFPVPTHPNWILKSMIETAQLLVKKHINIKIPSIVLSIRDEEG